MTTTKKQWTATADVGSSGRYMGMLSWETIEGNGDWHTFEVWATDTRLVFGGTVNVGFLESGYLQLEEGESMEDAIAELFDELQCYYRDGATYCNRIVCNERM